MLNGRDLKDRQFLIVQALIDTQIGSRIRTMTNHLVRHTTRVLLVDQWDCVLLFQGQDPANVADVFWCPVGGGIEPGESPEEAAIREVREETGLGEFELDATSEVMTPRRLAPLFKALLLHGLPQGPIDLGLE